MGAYLPYVTEGKRTATLKCDVNTSFKTYPPI